MLIYLALHCSDAVIGRQEGAVAERNHPGPPVTFSGRGPVWPFLSLSGAPYQREPPSLDAAATPSLCHWEGGHPARVKSTAIAILKSVLPV